MTFSEAAEVDGDKQHKMPPSKPQNPKLTLKYINYTNTQFIPRGSLIIFSPYWSITDVSVSPQCCVTCDQACAPTQEKVARS